MLSHGHGHVLFKGVPNEVMTLKYEKLQRDRSMIDEIMENAILPANHKCIVRQRAAGSRHHLG